MKKLLKNLALVVFAVMLPVVGVLTACGATPTNGANSVHFVSNTYDETTGFAVFEVDLNVPTKLEYKVNPSTWGSYDVTYTYPEDSAENKVRYTLINGVITVFNEDFQQIQVKVHINGKTDDCLIRLKKYPTRIFTDETSVKINSKGVYTITPKGEFAGGEIKTLSEHDYNFVVTSSDETIIKVPDSTRLTVYSLRTRYAKEKVSVVLCDTTWTSKNMSFEVEFEITPNAASGYLSVEGCSTFVNSDNEITINLADLAVDAETGKKRIKITMFVESSSRHYIESDSNCSTNNLKYITVSDDGSTLLIDPSLSLDLSVVVSSWTSVVDSEGNAFAVTFKLNLKA